MPTPLEILNSIDTIDAAIFTGDTFQDSTNLREFNEYLGRWVKESMTASTIQIASLEQTVASLHDALERMCEMHSMMMAKVDHGASTYDADTLREMNEAPAQAALAMANADGQS